MGFKFQGSVCSDLHDIKEFINRVLSKLEDIIYDKNLMFDIRLILNELIINGVIHGNKLNRDKCVNLYLEVKENFIKIEVVDEGQGINCDISAYDPKELKCCGRGLLIVNGLSDEVHIEKNRIVAIKHIH